VHPGRLVPHRLSRAALLPSLLSLAAGLAGCVSDRYVGSIGPTGLYVNRGYGLVLDLGQADLDERWRVVDPLDPASAPPGQAVELREALLDLDGDGVLHHDELQRHARPTLRLVSRSATVSATLEVDVEILGGKNGGNDFDGWTQLVLGELAGREVSPQEWRRRKLGPDFPARVAELSEAGLRVGLVDHGQFLAENDRFRRQIVRVVLRAPGGLDDALRADHDFLLRALSLNHQAAPLRRDETY
jgi:hypothetical protein